MTVMKVHDYDWGGGSNKRRIALLIMILFLFLMIMMIMMMLMMVAVVVMFVIKFQALVYNIFPPTTALIDYAIGVEKRVSYRTVFHWRSNRSKFVTKKFKLY